MTLDILSKANGIRFKNIKHNGMRKGCHCIQARDIGAYNTCPNGCKYCYANINHAETLKNYKLHDKNSPVLTGNIKETDTIQAGKQTSFIIKDNNLSLFD
jgi:DNA repair photolyase